MTPTDSGLLLALHVLVCYGVYMTPTAMDRHRDRIVNDIIDTARDYRWRNGLDHDHLIGIVIPDGVRSDLTRADIEQLNFMGIYEENK